jgi:hypothetical protein
MDAGWTTPGGASARKQKLPLSREKSEARSRTRTDDPFLTIDLEQGNSGTHEDTSGRRLSRKAAAFVEWLSAGGDDVCTT